jgi:hypothetical protein
MEGSPFDLSNFIYCEIIEKSKNKIYMSIMSMMNVLDM